jgi:hypothetical protein
MFGGTYADADAARALQGSPHGSGGTLVPLTVGAKKKERELQNA